MEQTKKNTKKMLAFYGLLLLVAGLLTSIYIANVRKNESAMAAEELNVSDLLEEESYTEYADLHEYLSAQSIIGDDSEEQSDEAALIEEDESNDISQAESVNQSDSENIPQTVIEDHRAALGAEYRDVWSLILVNKQYPIPEDYECDLVSIHGGRKADRRCVKALTDMMKAATDDGVVLQICSAYRTHEKQTELFHRKINKMTASGLSYMDAYSKAAKSVTFPGTSEHELGLAFDIITPGYSTLNAGFADTAAGKWLYEHAPEYGFILRYPKGKEEITGIIFEPWHFRYVGKKYAREMTDANLTLEEYLLGE